MLRDFFISAMLSFNRESPEQLGVSFPDWLPLVKNNLDVNQPAMRFS